LGADHLSPQRSRRVVAAQSSVAGLVGRTIHLANQSVIEHPTDDSVQRADVERRLAGERLLGSLHDPISVELSRPENRQDLKVERSEREIIGRAAASWTHSSLNISSGQI